MKTLEFIHHDNGLVEAVFAPDVYRRLEDSFCPAIDLSRDVSQQIHLAQYTFDQIVGPEALDALDQFASIQYGEGIIVFRVPYDLGVTCSPKPGEPASSIKSAGISERMQFALSRSWGFAAGVKAEGSQVVNNIAAVRGREDTYTGEGARRKLGWHNENNIWRFVYPGFDLSPRSLFLSGVSEQKEGDPRTHVAIVARAVKLMNPHKAARLRLNCANHLLPYRHRRQGALQKVGPVPVLLGAIGREEMCAALYPGMIEVESVEDELAIAELEAALDEVAIPLRIVPGVCCAISNGAVVHARSAFTPAIDAEGRAERWVQRLFTYGRPENLLHFAHNSERVFDLTLPA